MHYAKGMASIAGLPGASAMVSVGPPLLASPAEESLGSVLNLLVPLKPQLLSLEML